MSSFRTLNFYFQIVVSLLVLYIFFLYCDCDYYCDSPTSKYSSFWLGIGMPGNLHKGSYVITVFFVFFLIQLPKQLAKFEIST